MEDYPPVPSTLELVGQETLLDVDHPTDLQLALLLLVLMGEGLSEESPCRLLGSEHPSLEVHGPAEFLCRSLHPLLDLLR